MASETDDGGHAWQEQVADARPLRVREPPVRLGFQIGLGVLALVLFSLLVYTLYADAWARGVAVGLVIGLGVILALEILLMEPVYAALFKRTPGPLPLTPGQDNFVVGCPGCGTVFTVTEDTLERGSFSCHNCGRPGYVKDYSLSRNAIKQERCATCGNAYLEFLEHSECPVCHTFNAY